MCNRVATPDEDEINGYFDRIDTNMHDLVKIDQYEPHYHITAFTRPFLPFVANKDPLHVTNAMWKFVPENATMEAYAKYDTCNAKAEEVFEKRTFKDYILPKRGLVVLKGFFEGQEQADGKSQPFYIYPKEGGLLTLGCVYSDWVDKSTGEVIRTFAVLTTAANELMAEIHNKKKRMPVIIPPDRREWWMAPRTRNELQEYFVPYPDGYLAAHKVTRNMYKRGYDADTPEILQPIS